VLKYLSNKEILRDEAYPKDTNTRVKDQQGLLRIIASLLGQSEDTVALERPAHELLDSINILRLQAHVKRDLNKDVAMHDILQVTSIQLLSQ